jgi:hypothetical protein
MAARRIAPESLMAGDAEEATVTLTCLPGGDRPARSDIVLDGVPSAALVWPRSFGKLQKELPHRLFGRADAPLTELARSRQQAEGMT